MTFEYLYLSRSNKIGLDPQSWLKLLYLTDFSSATFVVLKISLTLQSDHYHNCLHVFFVDLNIKI